MSILANAKTKATSGSVKAAFTNEDGAIDLASIMVGIIVIGLIGGVIAATVFAVIPWAQDNAAKQQLDSVASAESAYIGLSTDGGQQQSFGSLYTAPATGATAAQTANNGKVVSPDGTNVLFDPTALGSKFNLNVSGTGNGAHYGAAVQSASGKIFFIGDRKTQPTQATGTGATLGGAATAGNAGVSDGSKVTS